MSPEVHHTLQERHRVTNDRFFELIASDRRFSEEPLPSRARPLSDEEIAAATELCAGESESFRALIAEYLPACKALDLIGRNRFDPASLGETTVAGRSSQQSLPGGARAAPNACRDEVAAQARTAAPRTGRSEVEMLLQDLVEKDATIKALRELVKTASLKRPSGKNAAPLFVPPGHFYSPVVEPKEVVGYVAARRKSKPPAGIDIDVVRHQALWSELKPHFQNVPFGANPNAVCRYGFENPHYSYGDGLILHAMLRRFEPSRLVEVGSGHSSACALDTIEHFLGWRTQCTFIEPHPALLKGLLKPGDEDRIRIVAAPVQETSLDAFAELTEGDFLFVDSTHVLKTGSDVCHELFEILPKLASGVIVHFHDMFHAFEYPDQWIFGENRSWNELYAMRAFLMYNAEFEILFFSDFFTQTCRETIERDLPLMLKNPGANLWLRRK
jgi:hypothetical protein